MRIGNGYDVHKLVEGRDLILGGVKIDYEKGLLGHSDADVLIHAIMDAILGAMAKEDIGYHFPDTSDDYLDIDSRVLLRRVYAMVKEEGYSISNIDATVIMQRPKLRPYIDEMRANIAKDLELSIDRVSVKATTTENLGFEGREEGVSTIASALLLK
ncbi:MAG: 2-C-methyl-D-erythritol 2,4-cyclodiphosphate synthase [Eubacteriales bacterium]|nr:2-C-methyl-D-erythritol 2,4-cyclodiphosphate synthase [Fenollaria sp.]MDD7339440.1 2-C-methyl-D-erythritol 2,4-cyclodiphosphate synthase [Eubacteriales bacterium]MDY3105273.1 2-C-methyl-D-erythritol 2,4-cyclodiphosphate synthase [Fenollaria sp.]